MAAAICLGEIGSRRRPRNSISVRSIFPAFPDNQQICLLRFNPATLEVERVVSLDNENGHMPVVDGYYGVPYWQERDGRVWFNTIIYRAIGLTQPDIVRLEFDWAEVR